MEDKEIHELIRRAVEVANKHGNAILQDCEGIREGMTAVALILSGMGVSAGMTLHQTMGLLMQTYKFTVKLNDEGHFVEDDE